MRRMKNTLNSLRQALYILSGKELKVNAVKSEAVFLFSKKEMGHCLTYLWHYCE